MPSHYSQNTLNLDTQASQTSETGKRSSSFQKIKARTSRIKQRCPDHGNLAALLNVDSESSSTCLENYREHKGKNIDFK